MTWLIVGIVLLVVIVAGSLYIIIEWIWSDTPNHPRPWQRKNRPRPPEKH